MILKLVMLWSKYRQNNWTNFFEDTVNFEKYKKQTLSTLFEQVTDDECQYALFQQDSATTFLCSLLYYAFSVTKTSIE
jgi:hypothetical protein